MPLARVRHRTPPVRPGIACAADWRKKRRPAARLCRRECGSLTPVPFQRLRPRRNRFQCQFVRLATLPPAKTQPARMRRPPAALILQKTNCGGHRKGFVQEHCLCHPGSASPKVASELHSDVMFVSIIFLTSEQVVFWHNETCAGTYRNGSIEFISSFSFRFYSVVYKYCC